MILLIAERPEIPRQLCVFCTTHLRQDLLMTESLVLVRTQSMAQSTSVGIVTKLSTVDPSFEVR